MQLNGIISTCSRSADAAEFADPGDNTQDLCEIKAHLLKNEDAVKHFSMYMCRCDQGFVLLLSSHIQYLMNIFTQKSTGRWCEMTDKTVLSSSNSMVCRSPRRMHMTEL